LDEEVTVAAYVIVDIEVLDPARYERYKEIAAPAVVAMGGKYLARGGRTEVLEGGWQPSRLVILEFPTFEQARTWLESDAYREARALRHATARTNMVVIEGVG
jgi:uncharacterized protein (DUF1330 family)